MNPHAALTDSIGIGETLHVGRPNTGDRQIFDRLVDQIFDRRWFTNNGQVVQQFERQLCEYLGVRHCIPVCNGTIGLQLACHALKLSGEIIVPAFTFVATPHAVKWEGMEPVFADVDARTHSLCPESARSMITSRTSAILAVHLWGNPCATARLQKLADAHGLRLIYDAAHAFGCSHGGTMIGNFGDCEVFSFHATKFFNTFEGGAIATNDDALAHRIRLMKNFGFESMDQVSHLGTNAKMAEICAAMGISMFARLDQLTSKNKYNYDLYCAHLTNIDGLRVFPLSSQNAANWQYVVIELDTAAFGSSRDDVLQRLHANGIRARRYFYPGCHKMQPYLQDWVHRSDHLINTERLCQRVLCLPTGTSIDETDIAQVCQIIRGW